MIPIVMAVDVTSFKCIIYINLIVPGLIFDIGGNKRTTKSNYYRYKKYTDSRALAQWHPSCQLVIAASGSVPCASESATGTR